MGLKDRNIYSSPHRFKSASNSGGDPTAGVPEYARTPGRCHICGKACADGRRCCVRSSVASSVRTGRRGAWSTCRKIGQL